MSTHEREPTTVRTNPHREEDAPENAARATGAMAGMFFPVIILAIVAIVVIGYFLLS
jgi:hypothetical protein